MMTVMTMTMMVTKTTISKNGLYKTLNQRLGHNSPESILVCANAHELEVDTARAVVL